jgi:hypothetical protein
VSGAPLPSPVDPELSVSSVPPVPPPVESSVSQPVLEVPLVPQSVVSQPVLDPQPVVHQPVLELLVPTLVPPVPVELVPDSQPVVHQPVLDPSVDHPPLLVAQTTPLDPLVVPSSASVSPSGSPSVTVTLMTVQPSAPQPTARATLARTIDFHIGSLPAALSAACP